MSYAQDITVLEKFSDFEETYLNNRPSDTIYVYNFWATWCKPCVKELPYFDSLKVSDDNVPPIKLILVSLDFKEQIESTLEPFLKNRKIKDKVVVLTDGKVNTWIDQVDPTWSGAIPATLVIKGDKKNFYEQSFHSYNELITTILKIDL